MDSKRLILIASAIVVGAIFCIAFNLYRRKPKKVAQVQTKEVSQAFMMDTFEPIEDFDMIYFDEHRGLVQIKIKK
jgi:hypothetical protein